CVRGQTKQQKFARHPKTCRDIYVATVGKTKTMSGHQMHRFITRIEIEPPLRVERFRVEERNVRSFSHGKMTRAESRHDNRGIVSCVNFKYARPQRLRIASAELAVHRFTCGDTASIRIAHCKSTAITHQSPIDLNSMQHGVAIEPMRQRSARKFPKCRTV